MDHQLCVESQVAVMTHKSCRQGAGCALLHGMFKPTIRYADMAEMISEGIQVGWSCYKVASLYAHLQPAVQACLQVCSL